MSATGSGESPGRQGGVTLPALRGAWPADAFEAWRERVAIMECDGVPEAGRLAEERVRLEWARPALGRSGASPGRE